MRLQLYHTLFLKIEKNPESPIDDNLQSISLPSLLAENEKNQQLYTCAYSEMNESYADCFIIKAVQEMLFENGVQQVSQECVTTLSTLMKLSIQNIGSYLRSAVIHFPINSLSSHPSSNSSESSSSNQLNTPEIRVIRDFFFIPLIF